MSSPELLDAVPYWTEKMYPPGRRPGSPRSGLGRDRRSPSSPIAGDQRVDDSPPLLVVLCLRAQRVLEP